MTKLIEQSMVEEMQHTTTSSSNGNNNHNNSGKPAPAAKDPNPEKPKTETVNELIVAEYNSLSTELNSRQGIRYQMVQFAVAALGALLTVSSVDIQNHLNLLIFAYPILDLSLSLIYITNAIESRRIKDYIKTRIEALPELNGEKLGWLTYREKHTFGQGKSLGNFSALLVFILTSWFSVIIGQQIIQPTKINHILLSIAIWVSIALTVLLLIDGILYTPLSNLAHKLPVLKIRRFIPALKRYSLTMRSDTL
jgi:hypothetical protein